MDMAELVQRIVGQVLHELQARPAAVRIRVLAARCEALAARVQARVGDAELIFRGEEKPGESFDRVLLPYLGCSDMADLATGRASGALMTCVLDLLLQGVRVEVLDFAFQAHCETAPGPLYRLYETHAQTLAGFGLTAFQSKAPDAVRLWDNLLTAEQVKQVAATGTGVIMVPKTAVITPLALEAANERKLTIQKSL